PIIQEGVRHLRTLGIVILVSALVVGAYFMGLYINVEAKDSAGDSNAVPAGTLDPEPAVNEQEDDVSGGGWLADYYEHEGQHWTDLNYQNSGPVFFNSEDDGSTEILVTPGT